MSPMTCMTDKYNDDYGRVASTLKRIERNSSRIRVSASGSEVICHLSHLSLACERETTAAEKCTVSNWAPLLGELPVTDLSNNIMFRVQPSEAPYSLVPCITPSLNADSLAPCIASPNTLCIDRNILTSLISATGFRHPPTGKCFL